MSRDAIAGFAIAGDGEEEEWALARRGAFRREWRRGVKRNRYPGVDASAPPVVAETSAPPTPTYDALPGEKREAVDRLAVAVRMKQTQGLV